MCCVFSLASIALWVFRFFLLSLADAFSNFSFIYFDVYFRIDSDCQPICLCFDRRRNRLNNVMFAKRMSRPSAGRIAKKCAPTFCVYFCRDCLSLPWMTDKHSTSFFSSIAGSNQEREKDTKDGRAQKSILLIRIHAITDTCSRK